jgi:hypothetical protein
VVQERGEPHLLILACCLTYPLQRTGRVCPARSPGRVLLLQISLGQTSSLHPLRRRLPGIVRGLHRYYRSVRLPVFVHHRRVVLRLPDASQGYCFALGERGISRFPCEVFRYVLGVCDRAGLSCTLPYRRTQCCLPLSPYSVGVQEDISFAAEYPARTFPCQRFDAALASGSA